MPTILYEQGFRFSFFASDGQEPPHVHVFKGDAHGKWWIENGAEARSKGFKRAERATIARIVRDRREFFLDSWNDFFAGS